MSRSRATRTAGRILTTGALVAAGLALPPLASAASAAVVSNPASLVNPFIGTSNAADDFPGADAPFGMVQWSPDTPSRPDGGGYEYNNSSITGFSLTHIAGPGCGAAGDIPILPTVGSINTGATDAFSHSNESASAGTYSVTLNNGVKTELTATTRTGMARFTFPSTTQANLIFKLDGSQNGDSNIHFTVVSGTEVSGQVTSGHFCGAGNTYTVYFDMVFDHAFATNGTSGNDGYVTFNTTGNQVIQAKVGISYVSIANATQNRTTENPNFNFDNTKAATQAAWNSLLGRVGIAGGTANQQTIFYTALYHSLLHPNVFSDVNGQYRGFDGNTHSVDSGHSAVYANYSGWDVYRSQAQLTALVDPSVASDIAQSMVDSYTQTGQFPKWSENNGETYVMVGDPGSAMIADYYAFGAHNFSTTTALNDMVAEATHAQNQVRPGIGYQETDGYLPHDGTYQCCNFYGPVSTALEYDSADAAVSFFATALGDTSDASTLLKRSQGWRNIYNSGSGLMQPRNTDGSWMSGFSGTSGTDMVEGTSWQYTGMVPFNLASLISSAGGASAYNTNYLDKVLAGFHGSGGSQSDLGNEPSLELPWEYDYTGQPYKTQHIVRQVQDSIWTNAPGGLAGNDDLGEMSSWYVWSALGMYPETPGTADLALGSPMFTQAIVTLPSGNTLTINGNGAADNAPYVQSATWNGSGWNNAYAPTSAITSGGTLTYTLGTTANTSWASAASAAPPSYDATGDAYPDGPIVAGVSSSLCIDDSSSSSADGTRIQLWSCNGTHAQQWAIVPDGTIHVLGGCLDVKSSGTTSGTLVQYYHCNGTGAQQWTTGANGSLVNPESGLCLDDPGSSTNTGIQLQIYTCNGTNAQRWTLP